MNFNNKEFEEFKFALEMIIASRSENGATLFDVQEDYYKCYGRTFASIFGNCWILHLSNVLLKTMDNIFSSKQLTNGHSLFFTNVAKSTEKLLEASKDENMKVILHRLKLYPQNNRPYRAVNNRAPNSFSSFSTGSASHSSYKSSSQPPTAAKFYNHSLIADNFFLELSHIDLQLPKSKKNQIERIGLCISGQTMKSAYRTISYSPYTVLTANVILNIGTIDLLNGRSVESMITDIVRLLNALKKKNLQSILTTLAPLPEISGGMEETRQAFNKFIRDNFHFIDIEKCFLSNEKRVLLECYQPYPKPIGGSKHFVTLWNRVGRQRVVQLMKREIPNIHSFF